MEKNPNSLKTIFVTGGAGFIGSTLVRQLIDETKHTVVTIDKLTYAGNLDSLASVAGSERHRFEKVDICDAAGIAELFARYQPDGIIHLAAESHVDRSIDGPAAFLNTNIIGTFTLLESARSYWVALPSERRAEFRFHHVSTDEVYGSLGSQGLFTEESPYRPNSPYSASKAASDHLARAWHHTYGLPVLMTNCSNNYGPFHFPEKLIPLMILNALEAKSLPVYGDGLQVRDWLYVEDHARAITLVFETGSVGEVYNIGGGAEFRNIDIVRMICDLLEELRPLPQGRYHDLITYVTDRPGHDRRYAIDASKLRSELGWAPRESLATGLRKTVQWYLDNEAWWTRVRDGRYKGERLGLHVGTSE